MKTKILAVLMFMFFFTFTSAWAGGKVPILDCGFDSLAEVEAAGGTIHGEHEFVESFDGNALKLNDGSFVRFEDVFLADTGSIDLLIFPAFDMSMYWNRGIGGTSNFYDSNSFGFWIHDSSWSAFIFEAKDSGNNYRQAWSQEINVWPGMPLAVSMDWKCNQKADEKSFGQVAVNGVKGWKETDFCQDIELGLKDLDFGYNGYYGGSAFIIERVTVTDRAKLSKKLWNKVKKLFKK